MWSIIIPAFNEQQYLPTTLAHLARAKEYLFRTVRSPLQLIVVDNDSTDGTAQVASAAGVTVVREPARNIARVRNSGAKAARGDILIFIDADTLVPETTLKRIHEVLADPQCAGGAVDTEYQPASRIVRAHLGMWRVIGTTMQMAQGAMLFCRRSIFEKLGGFDETLYMGEDVDFFWRMRKAAKREKLHVVVLTDVRVRPSSRRFDQWPLWRTLIWTNPLFILGFRRRRKAWDGWYQSGPR